MGNIMCFKKAYKDLNMSGKNHIFHKFCKPHSNQSMVIL